MNLGKLIERLEEIDPATVVRKGFNEPHSYRGYYEELAFEPKDNVSVGKMLSDCKAALGSTYEGWKGGEFTMHEYSDVHLAYVGRTGDELSELLLDYMLKDVVP